MEKVRPWIEEAKEQNRKNKTDPRWCILDTSETNPRNGVSREKWA